MNNKTFINLGTVTITASVDLAANRFVTANGSYPSSTDKTIGVTLSAAKAGESVAVCFCGIAVVEVGGNISTIGGEIKPGSNGTAVPSSSAYQYLINLDTATNGGFVRVKI